MAEPKKIKKLESEEIITFMQELTDAYWAVEKLKVQQAKMEKEIEIAKKSLINVIQRIRQLSPAVDLFPAEKIEKGNIRDIISA